jgi:hypothetical protein
MKLPNFLCAGAQKSGTTTLHDILVQHPNIFLPSIKEVHFFNNENNYKNGLRWYEKEIFANWKGEKAIGEITPSYMYFDYVPKRIYKDLGKDIKLIFILRNPVDRAYSQYLMFCRRGFETETFEKAIELEKERIKQSYSEKMYFSYIDRGFYASQIKRYLKYFPKENMFFIIFEQEFIKNRKQTIEYILKFLEVGNINLNLEVKSNPASVSKSKVLRDIIYKKPNVLRIISRFLIPNRNSRENILSYLDKKNRKVIRPKKLEKSIKKILLEKYFIDEIKMLEDVVERDLAEWYAPLSDTKQLIS